MKTLLYIGCLLGTSAYIYNEIPKYFDSTPHQGILWYSVDGEENCRIIDLSNTREELKEVKKDFSDQEFEYLYIEFKNNRHPNQGVNNE